MVVRVDDADLFALRLDKLQPLHPPNQTLLLEAVEDALDAHRLLGMAFARVMDVLCRRVAVRAVEHHEGVKDVSRAHHAPLLDNTVVVVVRVLVVEREVGVGHIWERRIRPREVKTLQCAAGAVHL